ncbi:hypothetical protein DL766_000010 [Monosporascus sp. MC13-8B]|uniref:Histone deacetylase domain-containing protein n=1 Tax=Monosporascus cannonballus TaxID=155416 RepID=A0ABY0HLG1_9PEZI|nr:hypothetical protein DL762_000379 [Monosporascus cannonballus]RYP01217.1 hypothetical protein DL763_000342 [Monosporascus cannonballus]RYP40209.1 hypothetical protein DL766_000010 [Monosporascus sp. MC13-8B]
MASPERRISSGLQSANRSPGDGELAQSLNRLSISSSHRTSSSGSPKGGDLRPSTAARNPISRTSSINDDPRSRSATPNLMRKSSTTSLRSVAGTSRPLSRRTSTTNLRPSTGKPSNFPIIVEKPAPTVAAVANEYFKRELDTLHAGLSTRPTETVVILHDACYGHRFSRPRSSKGLLSTIVERPERIQASVLGVSTAYVRLGERHSEGSVPIHPNLDPTTLPSIPFLILKTERRLHLDASAVTNVHGTKWMEELKMMCASAETKLATIGNELRRPDINRGSDAEPPQKLHEGDLYLCSESQSAFEGALGAVCEAVDIVFSTSPQKRAFVAVRPPGHHCSASHPSGFCWVNNVQVGIMHGVLTHGLTHAAIIDFDLHHGDGSQAIAWAHNKRGLAKNAAAWKKTSIGYFSLHDINSYPCEYGDEEKVKNASLCIDNAHGQNVWNVHLQEWKTEVEFWELYQSKYSILLEKARNYLRLQTKRFQALGQVPTGAIFLSAGFDASEWEGVGMQRHKVNVPTEFYARITRDVVKLAAEEGLGVDGRVISVLEGGYSDRALYSGVLSHLSGLTGNDPVFAREDVNGGLGHEMGNRMRSPSQKDSRQSASSEVDSLPKFPAFPYDPSWWSASELDQLDAYTAPTPPKPIKIRDGPAPTYCSPTRASEAKLTEMAKVRRSLSGYNGSNGGRPVEIRAITPPPPDVPWPAAAHELSNILIPSHRQTSSCKHEELNPEATKVKQHQSLGSINGEMADVAASLPPRSSTRMSLRERKPTRYTDPDSDVDTKTRRKTVGGALATDKRYLAAGYSLERVTGTSLCWPAAWQSSKYAAKYFYESPEKKEALRSPNFPTATKTTTPKASAASSQAAAGAASPPASNNACTKPGGESTVGLTSEKSPPKPTADAGNGMDKITNGMKRIKIKFLTKEERETRKREAAEKAAAKGKPAAEPTAVSATRPAPIELQAEPTTPAPTVPSIVTTPVSARDQPTFAGSSPPAVSTPATTATARTPDLFIPYQPEGPTPAAAPLSGPIRILDPNVGFPPAPTSHSKSCPFEARKLAPVGSPEKARGHRGHGFTASSPIPFAARPGSSGGATTAARSSAIPRRESGGGSRGW